MGGGDWPSDRAAASQVRPTFHSGGHPIDVATPVLSVQGNHFACGFSLSGL